MSFFFFFCQAAAAELGIVFMFYYTNLKPNLTLTFNLRERERGKNISMVIVSHFFFVVFFCCFLNYFCFYFAAWPGSAEVIPGGDAGGYFWSNSDGQVSEELTQHCCFSQIGIFCWKAKCECLAHFVGSVAHSLCPQNCPLHHNPYAMFKQAAQICFFPPYISNKQFHLFRPDLNHIHMWSEMPF